MSTDKLIRKANELLRKHYAGYYVEVVPTPDESAFFEAVIYGVEDSAMDDVTKHVHALDREIFRPEGKLLVPMVVDVEDTREYYPAAYEVVCSARRKRVLIAMGDLVTTGIIQQHVHQPIESLAPEDVAGAEDEYLPLAA